MINCISTQDLLTVLTLNLFISLVAEFKIKIWKMIIEFVENNCLRKREVFAVTLRKQKKSLLL